MRFPVIPVLALTLAVASQAASAAPGAGVDLDKVVLAPHQAVYDLKLLRSRGTRGIDSVRGRIVYDFSGSACEGYTLRFRQVSQLASAEGADVLSDLRSTTWEDQAAKKFRFKSENLLNEKRTEAVEGQADRSADAVRVTLHKPASKRFKIGAGAVFPTEHMRRIIAAARAGKRILTFPVYDGSDDGEKVYDTLTVIGHPIAPGGAPPADAGGKVAALAGLTRWPVTISYFERKSEKEQHSGEQTPVYAIGFELYENGISRALILDYSDFTLSGTMTSLDMKKVKPCK
jgi:hypothetical protein